MNKLILKSTDVNSTTIIPNFGAIMKMGKTFMYNEFLKYDDGKLAKFIASEEGIEEAEAKERISKWVEQLQKDLESGKPVVFDGVGELSKVDGKMKFVAKPISPAETPSSPEKKVEKPVENAKPKEEKKETTKPEPKKEQPPVVEEKKVKTSADFKAKEAVEKILKFKSKDELIAFTRGEERKTVVAALNTKLDELNGKKKEVRKEESKSTEVKPPKNVIKEVVQPTDKKEFSTPPVVEDKKEEIKQPEPPKPIIEEKKEEKPPVVVAPTPKTEKKEEPKVETPKKEEKTIKEKAASIEKPNKNKEEEDAAIAAIVDGVEQSEKQKGKRKKRWVLWIGLILILGGGGTFGFLKKDMIMGWFDKTHEPKDLAEGNEKEHSDENAHETETVNSDEHNAEESSHTEETTDHETTEETNPAEATEDVTEEVVAEEPEPVIEEPEVKEAPVVNNSSDGNWHIVAGCFSSKSNAENLVSDLQGQGYSSATILGKYNGLYTVRAASYNSKEEAKSALSSFTSSGNVGFIKNL